jgi:peptidoglycan LD-endopeptidase CwlK
VSPLNARSIARLQGVHPDLERVVQRCAADGAEFVVTEGLRTIERQRQLLAKGATHTLHSRHLTGHAVDLGALVDREIRWDWPLYTLLAKAMKAAAAAERVPIEWGGDWATFPDGPHFQLPFALYPEIERTTA